MTDREKAIVMAYTGVAMLTGDRLDKYYKYCSELLCHPAYTHEVFSNDIPERAKNDFIKLCKEDDEYRWHDLRKDPEDLPEDGELVEIYYEYYHFKADEVRPEYGHAAYFKSLKTWSGDACGHQLKIIAWRYIEPLGGEGDADL